MIDKNCPNCGNPFHGRSNRTYCSQSCKSAINNFRVAERDKDANIATQKVKANRRILMNLYNLYGNIELPPMVIEKTKLDKRWSSRINYEKKMQLFLDFCLTKLVNGNYLIEKFENE
jgi:uncharacterized Zn finger protein (UPF0148 family)